ncbi:MAG: HAD family hydrolase [Sedimentibacter sp.]|uniref:HAD family hydrolase n=1 Tax=Sedimentibacter sp. TaxID=1960295 RepID=UPI00315916F2
MIKGILFDKDGTIIDFSLWRNAGINTVATIMKEQGLEDAMIERSLQRSIGITEKGVEPFGALAYKTHEDVAAEIHFILSKYKKIDFMDFKVHVAELLRNEVLRDDVEFRETTDLRTLFGHLKDNGIKVGLATADSYQSAMHMVNKLNHHDLYDFFGSYDGVMKPKPNKDMCVRFCEMYGFKPYEVAIVGDSHNDMLFARNSGAIGVGVLSGVSSKINLKDTADIIIPSVDSLFDREVLDALDYEASERRFKTA